MKKEDFKTLQKAVIQRIFCPEESLEMKELFMEVLNLLITPIQFTNIESSFFREELIAVLNELKECASLDFN